MEWVKKIQGFYRKSRRALIYFDLIFIIVVFYAGKYLGPLRDQLLPAAIAGGFAILLESLFSISDTMQDKLGITQYTSISQAIPKMVDLVKQGGRRKHVVKIIASSGGTTVNTIIPALTDQNAAPLDVDLLMVDPDSQLHEHFPKHWAEEARATKNRLMPMSTRMDKNLSIVCRSYNYLPCVHGVLIDGQHLFLGFFMWLESAKTVELSGAQQPHVYYRRAPSYENLFRLFESWFDSAPAKQIVPLRE